MAEQEQLPLDEIHEWSLMHNISALLSCLVVPPTISYHHVHMFKTNFPYRGRVCTTKSITDNVLIGLLAQKESL